MIKYKKGYKYQLSENYTRIISIYGHSIDTEFIKLSKDGHLFIKSGYAWDGASGPTIDTDNSMEGSLVHDALYQLMRMGLLPQSCREYADELLKNICHKKGMWKLRSKAWCFMTRKFASSSADPKNKKKIYIIQ